MESFAPNHARGPAFILEHGDPDGIDLAHSVWPSAAPDRRVDRFDHLYKFLFDLTDGGSWLVDVHASS